LKFAPLLAQYLYTHKRLDLPGIGSFILDPSAVVEAEHPKQGKPVQLEGVSFENNSLVKLSPELIAFISAQSGKIKALAGADLESHLELAKQFLNIGKPFMFEGIGSLSKLQAGGYSFTPGTLITDKIKDTSAKDTSNSTTEEPATDYRTVFYAKKTATNWKKPLVILLLLAGIALAIWGGYRVYKKTTAKNNTTNVEEVKKDETVLMPDTARPINNDTTVTAATIPTPAAIVPAGNYKFVVETATKDRALKRFSKLKNMGLAIQMETADSALFKLFFVFSAAASDTARITDSLRKTYSPSGMKAYIEK
jgi:hypothetical protein